MYNNDYIIGVDENGQPYIAHSWVGDKARAAWGSLKNHTPKYISKEYVNGKVRYIYERAKAGAKRAWGSKAGRFIDSHDAGISEKLMEKRALRKAKQQAKKGNRGAEKYYAHRAMQLHQESAKERQAAKDYIGIGAKKRVEEASAKTKAAKTKMNQSHAAEQRTKAQADNLREAARKASGENFNKANSRYSNAASAHNKAQAQYESDTKAYRDAVREGHRATQTYNDSIIGKIERKVQSGKKLTKDEAQQFAAFLARVRNGNK